MFHFSSRRLLLMVIVFATSLSAFTLPPAKAHTRTAPNQSAQASPGVEGNWQGVLDVGPIKLRLVLKVARAADGKLKATMDSIDQSANDLVVDTIGFESRTLQFEMKRLLASYVGTLSSDGNQIEGKFTQNGGTLPLDFKRVTDASQMTLKRPQTPAKPYPYEETEVSYENKEDRIKLAATLTVPRGESEQFNRRTWKR